jgi:hypothetical protein
MACHFQAWLYRICHRPRSITQCTGVTVNTGTFQNATFHFGTFRLMMCRLKVASGSVESELTCRKRLLCWGVRNEVR